VEIRSRKKKGPRVGAPARMHIHSARGISDNGALVGDDVLCTTVDGADAVQGHNVALVGNGG
jgi:chloramphenicol 3-O-phosphotransferase